MDMVGSTTLSMGGSGQPTIRSTPLQREVSLPQPREQVDHSGLLGLSSSTLHGNNSTPQHGISSIRLHGNNSTPLHGNNSIRLHGNNSTPLHGNNRIPLHGNRCNRMDQYHFMAVRVPGSTNCTVSIHRLTTSSVAQPDRKWRH